MAEGNVDQRTGARPLTRRAMIGGLAAAMGGLVASCHVGPGILVHGGPPAHAPAHGFRRRHSSGVYLTFDSLLGVYIVAGHPHHYWFDGIFYRYHDGGWHTSSRLKRGWRRSGPRGLPPGLAKRGRRKGPPRGRGKRPRRGRGRRRDRD